MAVMSPGQVWLARAAVAGPYPATTTRGSPGGAEGSSETLLPMPCQYWSGVRATPGRVSQVGDDADVGEESRESAVDGVANR